MNQQDMERMIQAASQKSGADANAIRNAVNSGDMSKVLNQLNAQEVDRIKNLMNNQAALEKLLNSKQAQQLLKNLTEGK